MKRNEIMKKMMTYAAALLLVATNVFAGQITQNSSWEEIKADPTLKVVYPVIAADGGVFATYDNFHVEGNQLKSGKTYTKDVSWDTAGADDRRVNVKTVTADLTAPVNYTYNEVQSFSVDHDGDDISRGPFVKVQAKHETTMMASVYKKVANEKKSDRFLFSKPFAIAVK